MNSSKIQSILAAVLILAFTSADAAQSRIYKSVDENGNVVFTDIPPRENETGEQIVVENPNSFAVEEALSTTDQWIVDTGEEGSTDDAKPFSYQFLEIKSPQDDEAIRENAGNITVVVVSTPRLQRGHMMRLLLDGRPVQEGPQSQFSLENLDRGTHSITTEILDGGGNVLIRSASAEFHMLRYAGGG